MKSKSSLFIVIFTVFIDLVGFGIIIPLSPYLARQFSADPIKIGLLMSIFSLMQFIFSPLWGTLSDRFGRRPIIILSLFGAGLSYIGFAFSTTYWMLFISRAFAGTFSATISTANAYIADITEEGKERSKGMGLIGASFGLGFIFGPLIGALLATLGKSIGDAPPFGQSFSALGAAALCFANFAFAFFKLQETRIKNFKVTAEKKNRFKKLFHHFQMPKVGSLMSAFFLTSLAMALMEVMLFPFVEDVFGWGIEKASYGFAYVGFVMVFVQGYLIRKLLKKHSERGLLLFGLVIMAVGLGGIAFSPSIALLAVTMTLLALGNGIMRPPIMGLISGYSSKDEQGQVMGVTQSLSALGRILGPVIGGWFYQHISIGSPFILSGVLTFLAFLVVVLRLKPDPST